MPYKRRHRKPRRPPLYVPQILAWADDHHRRTGAWPTRDGGWVDGTADEKWMNVDVALRAGRRGLRPGSSLARLLAAHRGVRNRKALPALQVKQILAWADDHRRRTGAWPRKGGGPIHDAPGETWQGVDSALRAGLRGLPGGSSLSRLLERRRGVRNDKHLPRLTAAQV